MTNNESNIPDELDDLKSLWKSQAEEKSYDRDQIFKMIHRKSINSVQWLFVITVIELLLAVGFSLWALISGSNLVNSHLEELMSKESLRTYDYISHVGLIGSLVFVGVTFFYYRKISVQSSVKKLIHSIIKFRKLLFWFIVIWILLTIAFITPMYFEMGKQVFLHDYDKGNMSAEEINQTAKGVGIGLAVISTVLIILFSLLYYGIIYGIFLRRLGKNLKELKKIDA